MIKVKVKYKEYENLTFVGTKTKTFILEMNKDAWKNLFHSYKDRIITMAILNDEQKISRTGLGYRFKESCVGTNYDIEKVTIVSEYDDKNGYVPLSNADMIIYNGA
jgi:hypothetical protein